MLHGLGSSLGTVHLLSDESTCGTTSGHAYTCTDGSTNLGAMLAAGQSTDTGTDSTTSSTTCGTTNHTTLGSVAHATATQSHAYAKYSNN